MLALAALLVPQTAGACQSSAAGSGGRGSDTAVATVKAIELRDAKGTVTARIVPGHPCRATVDGLELLVGTQPLVAQVGDTRWSGDEDANGTTLRRNDDRIARIFPSDKPDVLGLYDGEGVAVFRATVQGDTASLVAASGATLREARRTKSGITVGDLTVTGTDDLLLAALIGAPEAGPEVRGLAACHRLFPLAKAL